MLFMLIDWKFHLTEVFVANVSDSIVKMILHPVKFLILHIQYILKGSFPQQSFVVKAPYTVIVNFMNTWK